MSLEFDPVSATSALLFYKTNVSRMRLSMRYYVAILLGLIDGASGSKHSFDTPTCKGDTGCGGKLVAV